MLLALLAESSSLFAQTPPTINQCRTEWVLSTLQDMNYGGFAVEGSGATITMNNTGGLTTLGPVSLSSSIPATTWTINIDNALGSDCAAYGFTIDLRRPPRRLRGPGRNITHGNIRATIPDYGLNNVPLPQVIASSAGNTVPFTMTVYGEITLRSPQAAGEYLRDLELQLTQRNRDHFTTTTVTATSIVPLSIAESVPMDFGTIAGGSVSGTVILNTGNGRITTGDAETLAAGPGNAATFEVAGEPNNSFSLSFSDGILANASGQQMNVTSFTHNSAGTIPGSGPESFQVGATLNVGASQQSGTYSTSNAGGNPYSVTINYE